jgi:hypothetical protein
MAAALQEADFSEVFGSEDFSDVDVLLYEEVQDSSSAPQQAGKRPRGAEEVLPGHKLVLRALSLYFKTKVREGVVRSANRTPAGQLHNRCLLSQGCSQWQALYSRSFCGYVCAMITVMVAQLEILGPFDQD